MLPEKLVRQDLPTVQVYVQHPDRSISPATPLLSDYVVDDLTNTRELILNTFGRNSLPPMEPETEQAIGEHFGQRKWTLPASVLIDPATDALALRSILRKSKFPSVGDEEFFTGANGQLISPGGSSQRDLIIFHDQRSKYRDEIFDLVQGWGYSIGNDELERVVELKTADFATHELAHMAGGLAVSAVVIEKSEEGQYQLVDRSTSGFNEVFDDIPSAELDDSYYQGNALNEGWASYQACRLIHRLPAHSAQDDKSIEDSYYITADIFLPPKTLNNKVDGLHSAEAGMVLEKLYQDYPGILSTLESVADRIMTQRGALQVLKSVIPPDIMQNLLVPNYQAWLTLRTRLEI